LTRFLLMIPGPSLVDPETLLEFAKPTFSHVSDEFDRIHAETLEMLRKVFGSRGKIALIPGSGTAAIEFAVRASIAPGEKVAVLKAGYFADYLAEAARVAGASVDVIQAEIGAGFSSSDLEGILSRGYSAVLLQHVETSTSVANPVEEIAKTARKHGAKVIVDGIASVGGMEMRMEEWGVDVCLTGSQKALATPPGLGIVAFREGFEPLSVNNTLYFNVSKVMAEMETTKSYYITPAVNMVYSLNRALKIIMEEGLERRYRRHKALADAVRSGLEAMGLKLVAEERFRADTVTAAYLPVDWPGFYREMKRCLVEVAGGLGELKGRIFRIGHMGEVTANDVIAALAAVERSLKRLGYPVKLGDGIRAAQESLSRSDI